jgi:hypothetical protein
MATKWFTDMVIKWNDDEIKVDLRGRTRLVLDKNGQAQRIKVTVGEASCEMRDFMRGLNETQRDIRRFCSDKIVFIVDSHAADLLEDNRRYKADGRWTSMIDSGENYEVRV